MNTISTHNGNTFHTFKIRSNGNLNISNIFKMYYYSFRTYLYVIQSPSNSVSIAEDRRLNFIIVKTLTRIIDYSYSSKSVTLPLLQTCQLYYKCIDVTINIYHLFIVLTAFWLSLVPNNQVQINYTDGQLTISIFVLH